MNNQIGHPTCKNNSMADTPRLIEHAFPLEQTSLDSVHEKNVRHGHISTLHCDTPSPHLIRVQDRLGNLLPRAKESVLIGQAQIIEAAAQEGTLI